MLGDPEALGDPVIEAVLDPDAVPDTLRVPVFVALMLGLLEALGVPLVVSDGVPLRLGDTEGVAEGLAEFDGDCVSVPVLEGDGVSTCVLVPLGLGVAVSDAV